MKNNTKNRKGFYFIEAILAIFVLTIGLLVVVKLLAGISYNTYTDRDNIVAAMLAQEGIELVRNLRDNNFAKNANAFDTVFPAVSREKCKIDKNSTTITDSPIDTYCGPNVNLKLYKSSSTGFYTHTNSDPYTGFRRRISVIYSAGGASTTTNYATITSLVTWGDTDIGTSFPVNDAGNPLSKTCTASAKCAYSQVVLTRWY